MEGLNQFHGANIALNSDVDQDTFGKVAKHSKQPRGQTFPRRGPQGYKEQKWQHNTHQHEA